jgi:hypothetical protein
MSLKHHREAIIALLTAAVDQCIKEEEKTQHLGHSLEPTLFDSTIKVTYKGTKLKIVSHPTLGLEKNPITYLAKLVSEG